MSRIRIMVVEDNEDAVLLMRMILEEHEFEICGMFGTGEEAVQYVQELAPDLILMDISLAGEIDGIEATEQIIQIIDVPIIYLSAHTDSKTLERAKITGPFGYIVKPVLAENLYASIEMTLYRHQMELKLKASEEKYRLLVEMSSDAIAIRRDEGYIYFNRAFSNILGYSDVELAELDVQEIHTKHGHNMLIQSDIQRQGAKNNLSQYESEIKKKDGSVIEVEVSSAIIEYRGQKASFEVLRDMTDRKAILKQLQESVDKNKSLAGIIPICASCKKIRDEDKEQAPWIDPELFISERLPDVKFSHGICPDCAKILYPEIVRD